MWRSIIVILACTVAGAQNTNPDAKTLEDFQKRVSDYVKLHNKFKSSLDKLKPTDSPERIARHEKELSHRIREAREHARQGDIFTAEIAAVFHRLIANSMQGNEATTVHQSLQRSEPVSVQLKINGPYPKGVPLQTTPPSLLLNLPKLPPEVEYRIVSRAVVLYDVAANLIVDYLPNAIP